MLRARHSKGSLAAAALAAALLWRCPGAGAATQTLRYTGTRIHTFTGAQYRPAFEDRFDVIDDVTVERTGNALQRKDDLDFTPAGAVVEQPLPKIERRVRDERVARRAGGNGVAILVTHESITTDVASIFTNVHVAGESPYETTETAYREPRTAVVLSGPRGTFHNAVARTISIASANATFTTTVGADGSVESRGSSLASLQTLTQRADGTGAYHSGTAGFSLYELSVDAPKDGPSGKTIDVERSTQGRTVGPVPVVTEDFVASDWYPGGALGPDRDDVRALGLTRLPATCEPDPRARAAYETIEERSQTRVDGLVETMTTTTFTSGDVTVCSLETTVTKRYEPTTGALVSTESDIVSLHLGSRHPPVSLRLYAIADRSPFASNVDPHPNGATSLVLGTARTGVIALRMTPAKIEGAKATLTIRPELADVTAFDGSLATLVARDVPGAAILTARMAAPNAASASIPVYVYRTVHLGCEGNEIEAVAFDPDGTARRVTEISEADAYLSTVAERMTCDGDAAQRTWYFPSGATALHFGSDAAAPFVSIGTSQFVDPSTSFDSSSQFGRDQSRVGSVDDVTQNILLIKTHTGDFVKLLCDNRGRFSLWGPYAVSTNGRFAF